MSTENENFLTRTSVLPKQTAVTSNLKLELVINTKKQNNSTCGGVLMRQIEAIIVESAKENPYVSRHASNQEPHFQA